MRNYRITFNGGLVTIIRAINPRIAAIMLRTDCANKGMPCRIAAITRA